jgi:sec-independent protein translocase protein TatA
MPFGLHPLYLVALVAIVLIIFGPGKLPELGGAVGRGIREFRRASDELADPPAKAEPGPDAEPASSKP